MNLTNSLIINLFKVLIGCFIDQGLSLRVLITYNHEYLYFLNLSAVLLKSDFKIGFLFPIH